MRNINVVIRHPSSAYNVSINVKRGALMRHAKCNQSAVLPFSFLRKSVLQTTHRDTRPSRIHNHNQYTHTHTYTEKTKKKKRRKKNQLSLVACECVYSPYLVIAKLCMLRLCLNVALSDYNT